MSAYIRQETRMCGECAKAQARNRNKVTQERNGAAFAPQVFVEEWGGRGQVVGAKR